MEMGHESQSGPRFSGAVDRVDYLGTCIGDIDMTANNSGYGDADFVRTEGMKELPHSSILVK